MRVTLLIVKKDMPMYQIRTTEYECNRCGYKWIERRNGMERKSLPRFCRKCKSYLWNTERTKNTVLIARKWYDRQAYETGPSSNLLYPENSKFDTSIKTD